MLRLTILSIIGLSICATSGAYASDYCRARQILEAKIALAKDHHVKSSAVQLVRFEPGFWTELVGNNTGSDSVTVALKRGDEDPVIESYTVFAMQVGTSADCKIRRIE